MLRAYVDLRVIRHLPEQIALPEALDPVRETVLVLRPVLFGNDRAWRGIAVG
jgi:hypothetical protein